MACADHQSLAEKEPVDRTVAGLIHTDERLDGHFQLLHNMRAGPENRHKHIGAIRSTTDLLQASPSIAHLVLSKRRIPLMSRPRSILHILKPSNDAFPSESNSLLRTSCLTTADAGDMATASPD